MNEGKSNISVTEKNLREFLGEKKYTDDKVSTSPLVGVVNGLAWTQVGGELLQCESVVLSGTGKIQVTGKLGDVMKESVQAAVSFIRSISEKLEIQSDFYEKKDIHIHFPEGAVPKDGPSAGITVATAVASALSGIPVRSDIAMTGEISLRGRVLPIGGLKEKSLAAYRMGITDIIIPKGNIKDIQDIPAEVRDKISFHPVENCEEVLYLALCFKERKKSDKENVNFPKERSLALEYTQC